MKTVNELIENAISMLEQLEPRKYLFPDFYKKVNDHLIYLLDLKNKRNES